jgi:hypothetical protein
MIMSDSTRLKKGTYKNLYTKNDTIISLFCAKFPNKLNRLGFHDSGSNSAIGAIANQIIGTSEYSLVRQIGNLEYIMGKNDSQYCTSKIQREVFDKFFPMKEEEFIQVCTKIIENTPKSVYEKYLEIEKKNMGIEKAITERKTRETFKAESDARRDAELRRLGFDPSKMKSKGIRRK